MIKINARKSLKSFRGILLVLIALHICTFLSAQMAGIYTIGPSNSDYPSIDSAWQDLVLKGIQSSVIFNIKEGSYVEQLNFTQAINGSDSLNTITFRAAPNNTQATIISYNTDYTIKIGGGTGYLHFDSLEIETSGLANVVEMTSTNDFVTFTGNTFKGALSEVKSDSLAVIFDAKGNNTNNFSFIGNKVLYGGIGIRMIGDRFKGLQHDIRIEDNVIDSLAGYGIFIDDTENLLISGNKIRVTTSDSTNNAHGLNLRFAYHSSVLNNNILVRSPTKGGNALFIQSCNGDSTHKTLIANNMISMPEINQSLNAANYIWNCDHCEVVYNSFYGEKSRSTNYALLTIDGATNSVFKNNSVYNNGEGFALDVKGSIDESHNNLYGNSGNSNLTGITPDITDVFYIPTYVSPSIGDLHNTASTLIGKGTPIQGVSIDYDGDLRDNTKPTIGADEIPFAISIDPFSLEDDWRFYPNPMEKGTIIRIESDSFNSFESFTVFSMMGEMVQKGKVIDHSIRLQEFQSGVYYLSLDDLKPQKIVIR